MTLRHATALALVGWYLMLPPTIGRHRALTYAPLSQWKVIDTFDSEGACQQRLSKLIERMPDTAIDTARCCIPNSTNGPYPDPYLDGPYFIPEQEAPNVVG